MGKLLLALAGIAYAIPVQNGNIPVQPSSGWQDCSFFYGPAGYECQIREGGWVQVRTPPHPQKSVDKPAEPKCVSGYDLHLEWRNAVTMDGKPVPDGYVCMKKSVDER